MRCVLEEVTMDLILWRHADAEDGSPDLARELTAKGHKQAAAMARWLSIHLPKDVRTLVSPAIRARQTAEALTRDYASVEEIGTGASYAAVLSAAGWPEHKGAVLVVGHQPTLGQVAAYLITNEPADWNIKKGAIWWFTCRKRSDQGQVVLRAVMSPELV
jgi:phosphohistidine phosphatase